MKKKIIILALILVSGISLVRSQPVTGIRAADMKSLKGHGIELSFSRDGNDLAVSAKAVNLGCDPRDTLYCIMVRLNITGNTRKELSMWLDETTLGMTLVDESTGKSTELKPENNDVFKGVITFPESHAYKFMLNGKLIGTGFKPK